MARKEFTLPKLGSDLVDDLNDNFVELYETNAQSLKVSEFMEADVEGDDRGIRITNGQLSVGIPEDGREVVIGEGDSYAVPIAFHIDMANFSGNSITGATDITSILQSDSGSAIGLTESNTSGKALLIGSPFNFGGAKVKVDTAGVIEHENLTVEFLYSDSMLWIEAPYMSTDSDWPYKRRGPELASISGISEQWRFGFDKDNIPTPWLLTTLNINGYNYTYKWAILRYTSDVTSVPMIEQIKLHTNRWECNKDGVTEYFGRSRYPKVLQSGIKNAINNAVGSPANENVQYAPGITANYIDNEFANGAIDGLLLVQNIVENLDTSIPLTLDFSYYVKGDTAGDIEMHADVIYVDDGFTYDGNAVPEPYNAVIPYDGNETSVRRSGSIKIPVNTLSDGGILIHLHRDATNGNANDTVPHNIVLTNIVLTGHFYR